MRNLKLKRLIGRGVLFGIASLNILSEKAQAVAGWDWFKTSAMIYIMVPGYENALLIACVGFMVAFLCTFCTRLVLGEKCKRRLS